MRSRLVNVRLDAVRLGKVQTLRERGVSLSELVRDAIDERFASVGRPDSPLDVRATIARIFNQHPDPPNLPRRPYNVHDRRAARGAILRKLRSRRP